MQISVTNLTLRSLIMCAALALFVAGCAEQNSGTIQSIAVNSSPLISNPITDKWLGKWEGPEGTFLQLEGGNGEYRVTIQNLDGPSSFLGKTAGDQITFERNGVNEFIHATNGDETGMKWLSGKTNCLTVHTGEGYCRD